VQDEPAAPERQISARFYNKLDGPFEIPVADPSVTWLRQVHGSEVVVVNIAGQHRGANGDAAVTNVPGAKLAVRTADCAPVLLRGLSGEKVVALGVAHAGWRGLIAGVLPATVGALRGLGAERVSASLYPAIGPECYEFGGAQLDTVATVLGDGVRGPTVDTKPSLNMTEAVRASLAMAGVDDLEVSNWACTACDPERFFSFRARRDTGRMALVACLIDPRCPSAHELN
jgi:polyphenol oxidase